jgi:hypothetical protein
MNTTNLEAKVHDFLAQKRIAVAAYRATRSIIPPARVR